MRLRLAIALLAAVLLCCAAWFCITIRHKSPALLGSYQSSVTEALTNADGLACVAHIYATEHLSLDGLRVTGTATLTFELSELLEFRDIALRYAVALNGDWQTNGLTLTITPDTTTFTAKYLDSNAHTPVEEAMARQLKNNVADHLHAQLRERLRADCQRRMDVQAVCQGGIVGAVNSSTVILLRAN